MTKRLLLLTQPLLALFSHAFAANCELGEIYVGDQAQVTGWIGSYEKAAAMPGVWTKDDRWQMNRLYKVPQSNKDFYAVGRLMADAACVQGLNVQGNVEIRLNGEDLERIERTFFNLNLKKGKNLIEFRLAGNESKPAANEGKASARRNKAAAKKNKKEGGSIHLTFVDLDHIFTPTAKKIEYARRTIRFLEQNHPAYRRMGYLGQLAALEAQQASDAEVEAFRYKALVTDNPELDFSQVIFRQSGSSTMPSNWRGNSQYLRRAGQETTPKFGDSLQILDLENRTARIIYQPDDDREGLMDICLHYDGKRFLYSGVDTGSNTFQVHEMNIDGSGRRQITPILPDVDNYNGVYLPNGRILFCSTASLNSVPCVGGKDYVGTLYEIGADGEGMRQVTFDQENDWYPYVKETGRVMYHRWEYTDNSHYFTRILMEMNPDGTSNRSIYGSNSYWPNTMFYAKQIPGHTARFSAVVSGHHGEARAGELWLFDASKSDFETEGAMRKIPGYGQPVNPPHVDRYVVGKWPLFLHPLPINENFFLVSCQQKPGDKWGLYLVDTFDNMIRLCESKSYQFEPVPIRSRETPPVIPDRTDRAAKDATLYIQDIHAGPGLAGVPRGEVAGLRIFTYGYAYRMTGSHDALAIEGGWDTKRILGTVPVEEDGSVMVRIPHSRPLSLQPVDKQGRALQVMRSWLAAQPGEQVSCVGCHEPSRSAPVPQPTLASNKAPRDLTPWSELDRPYGFGFKREVQPVLDRYCVGCHDGTKTDRPDFKDEREVVMGKAHFGASYMALHPWVRRPGPESDLHILTPMDYHASTSELFQILEKGHYGVGLDDESMRRLIAWVDLNVPYHATWTEFKDDVTTRDLAARTVAYKKRFAKIDDAIEWMPAVPSKRPDFVKPQKPPKPPAPMKLAGWPLSTGNSANPETQSITFGDSKLTMVRIPAGKFVMGSVDGARDEFPQSVVEIREPFWMSATEVTNAQFREFMPQHDSRFIDQQWKDHIYAGYPADKPEMPAVRVTWNDALAFTGWLGKQTGKRFGLPTEAQWEWAARAGSDQPFHFGETGFEAYANLADESIGLLAVRGVDPQPLPPKSRTPLTDFVPRDSSFDDGRVLPNGTAQYKPNPWGLFDMHGNVAEWTSSSYRPYPYDSGDGRNALDNGERKVARGGSWRDRPKTATASHRLAYQPFQKVYNVGFRVIIEE